MPKPEWLIERERTKNAYWKHPHLCGDCMYLGTPVGIVKHNGKKTTQYECAIHEGCFNTEFSVKCGDFVHR